MPPYTVLAVDLDGNGQAFHVSAPDVQSARELLLRSDDFEETGVCAILEGQIEVEPVGQSPAAEPWTVFGLFAGQPFAWATTAVSAAQAREKCWLHHEEAHGFDALGNLPLALAGALLGDHGRRPLGAVPLGPRSRLSPLAARLAIT